MMETERIRIYPAGREQMEKTIAAETDEDNRKAYNEMLEGCLTFFLVEEGKDPGGFIDVVVYIGPRFYQNIYVGGQPCRLFQNQHQAGSAFEAEGHSDTFDRFQQAEGIQGPLNQARIGDVFLLQFPDVIKLVNSFVDHLSSSRTMRVSS